MPRSHNPVVRRTIYLDESRTGFFGKTDPSGIAGSKRSLLTFALIRAKGYASSKSLEASPKVLGKSCSRRFRRKGRFWNGSPFQFSAFLQGLQSLVECAGLKETLMVLLSWQSFIKGLFGKSCGLVPSKVQILPPALRSNAEF